MAEAGSNERGLYTYVGSLYDGALCHDASDLAEMYGGPVFEPEWWPVVVDEVHYSLAAQPPSVPVGRLPPKYYIFVTSSDDVRVPLVVGFAEPPSVLVAQSGWNAHPELGEFDGHVREEAGTVQLVLRRDGQTVQLGPFASVRDAVTTARSLRRVDPPS